VPKLIRSPWNPSTEYTRKIVSSLELSRYVLISHYFEQIRYFGVKKVPIFKEFRARWAVYVGMGLGVLVIRWGNDDSDA
jgi:hypothetical protein